MNSQREKTLESLGIQKVQVIRTKKGDPNFRYASQRAIVLPSVQPKSTQHTTRASKFKQYISQARLNKLAASVTNPSSPQDKEEEESTAKNYEDEEAQDKEEFKQFEGDEYAMALIGGEGLQKFHKFYKKQKRLEEIQAQYNKNPPAAQIYLRETQRKGMIPKALGLVKSSGPRGEISIASYSIGDNYASAFSTAIKKLTLIDSIDLSDNRLSNKGVIQLLENTPTQLKKINLASNKINFQAYTALSKIILQSDRHIKELILDNNKAGDSGAIEIAKALETNFSVSFLSLRY